MLAGLGITVVQKPHSIEKLKIACSNCCSIIIALPDPIANGKQLTCKYRVVDQAVQTQL
jgi:hypothetical protein